MRDKGYKDSVDEAIRSPGNQMGLDRPMLAHPIKRVKNVDYRGAVLQKKLDGHRCLITQQDDVLIAYTRQGKPIPSIRHIIDGLTGRLPEGVTLDGELYCHGVPLQTIGSWIKREQPDTSKLYYVVYDIISPDSYTTRHEELSEIVAGVDTGTSGKVVALPYRPYVSGSDTSDYFRDVRRQGFEGLMLRLDGRGYEAGQRSTGLLKIKEFFDGEFKVIGFEASSTGWAICQCVTEDGNVFGVSAPGSVKEKTEVLRNSEKYLGRMLTIEFAHWTNDGIPFQPTAIRWRDDI